jgi:hypothetical protein
MELADHGLKTVLPLTKINPALNYVSHAFATVMKKSEKKTNFLYV